jgi:DeoR/GlpR family transcriptional regulator of sugar metabolism
MSNRSKGEKMPKEREGLILEYLRERGEAAVGELCAALFVSEPTMRRALARLAAEGKIIRTYGGAAYRGELGENLPQDLREREHSDAKTVIGRRCLDLIRDGDTVMVDGSSTAMALLRVLAERKSVVVVTNSAKAPLFLGESSLRVFVTGGEIAPHTYAYVGSYAEGFLRDFHADICFFSVRTLTMDGALTDNAIAENAIRRVMLSRSDRSVLMLDSQKLGAPCLNTLCRLSDVTHVVSERDISAHFPDYRHKFL